MTPAIKLLQKNNIEFTAREYSVAGDSSGYGMQAANALKQNPEQVFKTLLVVIDGNERKPVVAVAPVASQLDLKKTASVFGGRKAKMAEPALAERVTGYLVGGISPIGQKQTLRVCIDKTAEQFDTVFVSGGKRGLQLEIDPADLIDITHAFVADVSK